MIRELIARLQAAVRAFFETQANTPSPPPGEAEAEVSNVRSFHPARRWRG